MTGGTGRGTVVLESEHHDDAKSPDSSPLFGKRLLFVVIWTLPIISASIVSPVLAYLLTASDFGLLASGIALHQLLSVLALCGLDQAVLLQRLETDGQRAARRLLAFGIGLSLLTTGLLGAFAVWWAPALGFGGHFELVAAVILWTGPGAAVQMMLALLSAEDRLRAFGALSVISAVGGQVFGIVLLFTWHRNASTYAWGGVLSQLLAAMLGVALLRPAWRGIADWAPARRAMRFGLPLALGGLSFFILNASDRIIIQSLKGPAEAGRYQIAYTVGYVLVLLLSFTAQSWTPHLAAINSEAERFVVIRSAREALFELLIPATLGLTLAAPVALRIVAPERYRPDSLLLVTFLVALSAFPVAAGTGANNVLLTRRKTHSIAVSTTTAAGVNVVLNLALVPSMGIDGSAAAAVLAFLVQYAMQYRAIGASRHELRVRPRVTIRILGTCVACAISTQLPQSTVWNLARLAVALACLPWFIVALVRARRRFSNAPGTEDAACSAA